MPYSSNLGYREEIDQDAFGEYEPCGAIDAYLMRNNAAHMIDQSPPTYINFMALVSSDDATAFPVPRSFGGGVGVTSIWPQTYVHKWLHPDRPSSVHLRVRARCLGVGDVLTLRARIIPAHFGVGDLSAPSLLDVTDTMTSTTFSNLIDDYAFITEPRPDLLSSFRDIRVAGEDGSDIVAQISLMRLELHAQVDDDEANCAIGAVWLRGFAQ